MKNAHCTHTHTQSSKCKYPQLHTYKNQVKIIREKNKIHQLRQEMHHQFTQMHHTLDVITQIQTVCIHSAQWHSF